MPPPLLLDLASIDLDAEVFSKAEVYERFLPHRHEFMLLDGICYVDHDRPAIIAYVDILPDAWWCRGHVPGRPLMPGVLMLESAAQSAAVLARLTRSYDAFIGFGGVEGCKFRKAVVPPARLYLLTVAKSFRPRRIQASTQGVVNGELVFETTTSGMTMP